jgi:glycosyltransferase involved in cell wall biosynthesis
MKVFEYLACARPVVAYDSPELSFVGEVDAGRLVAEVSPDAIRDALGALLGRTSTERERMGAAGREYIVANRTWATLADRIVTVIEPHV